MINKEIAGRLRWLAIWSRNEGKHKVADYIESLANELDSSQSKLGAVVWWKYPDSHNWEIARVHQAGNQLPGTYDPRGNFIPLDMGNQLLGIYDLHGFFLPLNNIEYKPANITGPTQEDRDE